MLIVHHWDTDGICSAAKIIDLFEPEDPVNMTPPIGEFRLDDRILDEMERHDEIFILDLNIPSAVERIGKRVTFIDHHDQEPIRNPLVTHINPVLAGDREGRFPSCTTVISWKFDSWDLLSALGAVGDVGEASLKHDGVRKVLEREDLDIGRAARIVSLLDSNYVSMDRDAVESAVGKVLEGDVRDIIEDRDWNARLKAIDNAVEEALSKRIGKGPYCIIDITTPYNVISRIARTAVWELGFAGALVVNRDLNGRAQTYLRIDPEREKGIDMRGLIDALRKMDINAGGKREVLGSVYPAERVNEVVSLLASHIGMEDEWKKEG